MIQELGQAFQKLITPVLAHFKGAEGNFFAPFLAGSICIAGLVGLFAGRCPWVSISYLEQL